MDKEVIPEANEPKPPSPAPIEKPEPVDTVAATPATTQQLAAVEKQMSGFEKSTLRWARTAVVMSALAAIFVCAQWWEMHEGGIDTHNLAVAAGTQATQTTNLAASTGTQADRTKDLADRMKDQSDQTKIIADQAVVQASANRRLAQNAADALLNTQESFRDEQRAWIGMEGIGEIKGFTETEAWRITVIFFNSGRTPARNVQISDMFLTSPTPISGPTQEQIGWLKFKPAQSIAPQGRYNEVISADSVGEAFSIQERLGNQTLISQYSQIKGRRLMLYYFGILKYDDIFGKAHETQYCIMLADTDTKQAGMCDAFNDLD